MTVLEAVTVRQSDITSIEPRHEPFMQGRGYSPGRAGAGLFGVETLVPEAGASTAIVVSRASDIAILKCPQ